jgi:predicted Ser/Thr protein kinase
MERAEHGGEVPRPGVGEEFEGYRLEAVLGEGGQGIVYRCRRGGCLYALKLLSLARGDWAWREMEVRLRLRRLDPLGVFAGGIWPHDKRRYVYLVMPYVRGRSLKSWVRVHNPSARRVVELLDDLVFQLAHVHDSGVVHRDIKPDNVVVRHEDGQAVLVDFGVGTYLGARDITNPWALPGTPHYRSPEALRFRREHLGEHAPARVSDDLWALGVLLYWLLTGAHPFETLSPDEGVLANLILGHEPEPPHVLNPRVPQGLSELCQRMLEKSRDARYPSARALEEELTHLLAGADGTWDVALCDTWAEDDATTPQERWLGLATWRDRLERLAAHARRRPRRGRPLSLHERSTLAPPPPPCAVFRREGRWSRVALLGWGLLLVLAPSPKMALEPKRLEGEAGAAPTRASIPAPVAGATTREDPTRVSTPSQPPRPTSRQPQTLVLGPLARACTTAAALASGACATPASRPYLSAPPPAECPPGAWETMQRLGMLNVRVEPSAVFPNDQITENINTVRPGPVTLTSEDRWGELPVRTLFLGELYFGDKRVFGRLTQARTPDGRTYPVCAEIWRGLIFKGLDKEPGSTREAARVFASPTLVAVERFE